MGTASISSDGTAVERKQARLFRFLAVNLSCTFLLGAIFYADPFHFWEHALSELGTTITLFGKPNLASAVIITLGTFINGRLMLEIARLYQLNDSQPLTHYKSGLMYTASLGSFISIFPNNLFHLIHSIGTGLLIGSIFLFDLILLKEGFGSHPPTLIYFLAGILSFSVLSYAVTFFMGLQIKQAAQKYCVINLLLILFQGNFHPRQADSPSAVHRPA